MQRVLDFLVDVKNTCAAAKVELVMVPSSAISMEDGGVVAGYFDSKDKKICVSLHHEMWTFVLAHEMGHLNQWEQGMFTETKYYEIVARYMAGEKLPKKVVEESFAFVMECEYDAELFAVHKTQTAGVSGDIAPKYIAGANAYVFSYYYMMKTRQPVALDTDVNWSLVFPTRKILNPREYTAKDIKRFMAAFKVASEG